MTTVEIEAEAAEIVDAHFKRKPEDFRRETRLREKLGGDWVSAAKFVFEFEQAVDIRTLSDAVHCAAREASP